MIFGDSMPQTSEERRKRWPGWDSQAIDHLVKRGYIATRQFTWRNPLGLAPTIMDEDAVIYLIEEFDWGGWAE